MTTLRNFDIDTETPVRTVTVKVEAPVVQETLKVTPQPSESRTHLLKDTSSWGWHEVRDYVVKAIEERHGPFPRDSKKEYGIFNSFCSRWGAQAGPIAQFAFEVQGGMWAGAPISINRFCKGSDVYFACKIAERL